MPLWYFTLKDNIFFSAERKKLIRALEGKASQSKSGHWILKVGNHCGFTMENYDPAYKKELEHMASLEKMRYKNDMKAWHMKKAFYGLRKESVIFQVQTSYILLLRISMKRWHSWRSRKMLCLKEVVQARVLEVIGRCSCVTLTHHLVLRAHPGIRMYLKASSILSLRALQLKRNQSTHLLLIKFVFLSI